ncbi:MAG: hypothetical protein HZC06_07970, partial [Methylocystis sp.]|nr:hypothetical protein [Methylocystis sp.]
MTKRFFGDCAPQLVIALSALSLGVSAAMAQTPSPSFVLTGHIEKFTLDTPAEKFSPAKITVRG